MNFFQSFKNKLKKLFFCFNFDSVRERTPIEYQQIFVIETDDSDDSDLEFDIKCDC